METNLLNLFDTDPEQLENYIRQIKSYEAQVEIVGKRQITRLPL